MAFEYRGSWQRTHAASRLTRQLASAARNRTLRRGHVPQRVIDPVLGELARVDGLLEPVEHGGDLVGGDPQRDVGASLQCEQHRGGDTVALIDRTHAGQVVGVHQPVERRSAVVARAQQSVGRWAQAGRVAAGQSGTCRWPTMTATGVAVVRVR
jgi:hypothetical protein